MMEMDGLVSPGVGGKPREVLVDKAYFDEVDAQFAPSGERIETADILPHLTILFEHILRHQSFYRLMLCGDGIARLVPLKPVRIAAAVLFAVLGVLTLLRWDFGLLAG